MNPAIKICGLVDSTEINLLDQQGVDYAGLWHGIPQGRYNLELAQLQQLTQCRLHHTKVLLVTMSQDLDFLSRALNHCEIHGIQFHGFPLPGFIRQVKQQFGSQLKIFNVLHVQHQRCVEENLIARYLDAGTDFFILDSFQSKHHIGSTGIRLDGQFLHRFFDKWNLQDKAMIAGGIDETCIADLYQQHQPHGFDIDSAVRHQGRICPERLGKLLSATGPGHYTSVAHASIY